jgi:hypothetical protein
MRILFRETHACEITQAFTNATIVKSGNIPDLTLKAAFNLKCEKFSLFVFAAVVVVESKYFCCTQKYLLFLAIMPTEKQKILMQYIFVTPEPFTYSHQLCTLALSLTLQDAE